jgi:hypothetical protein
MCVLIKDLSEKSRRPSSAGPGYITLNYAVILKRTDQVRRHDGYPAAQFAAGVLLGFLCVSGFSARVFRVFFQPQKVHYNALFIKISPKHAL